MYVTILFHEWRAQHEGKSAEGRGFWLWPERSLATPWVVSQPVGRLVHGVEVGKMAPKLPALRIYHSQIL